MTQSNNFNHNLMSYIDRKEPKINEILRILEYMLSKYNEFVDFETINILIDNYPDFNFLRKTYFFEHIDEFPNYPYFIRYYAENNIFNENDMINANSSNKLFSYMKISELQRKLTNITYLFNSHFFMKRMILLI